MNAITWNSVLPEWLEGKRLGHVVAVVFESLIDEGEWKWRRYPYVYGPSVGGFTSAEEAMRAAEEALS